MLAQSISKGALTLLGLLLAAAGVILVASSVNAAPAEDCEDCETSLSVSVTPGPCVPEGAKSGSLTVSLKNPTLQRDILDVAVSANGQVKSGIDVPANSTKDVDFDGLEAGSYNVKVKEVISRTDVEKQVELEECPAEGEVLAVEAPKPAKKLPVSGPEVAINLAVAAVVGSAAYLVARRRL